MTGDDHRSDQKSAHFGADHDQQEARKGDGCQRHCPPRHCAIVRLIPPGAGYPPPVPGAAARKQPGDRARLQGQDDAQLRRGFLNVAIHRRKQADW